MMCVCVCVCVNRELMGGVPSVSMATGHCVYDVCVCVCVCEQRIDGRCSLGLHGYRTLCS